MPFIPHTEADVSAMLESIGVTSIDDLFDEIPQALRSAGLTQVPEGLPEMDVARLSAMGVISISLVPALTNIIFLLRFGKSSRAANFIPRTRRIKPRPVRARYNCCTNSKP
jgi:hypothetical protein